MANDGPTVADAAVITTKPGSILLKYTLKKKYTLCILRKKKVYSLLFFLEVYSHLQKYT